jgi:hypothetical protein
MIKIEITYSNGEKYAAYIADASYDSVTACLTDDTYVPLLHSMGNAEGDET